MCRFIFFLTIILSSCTTTYYVVRHAEKESGTAMTATTIKTSDVPLSVEGEERAEALKNLLINKNIKQLWSTNTIRAKATITPYSNQTGRRILFYSNDSLSTYIQQWKNFHSGALLLVGHSNTVDDIVNELNGEKAIQDLPDGQYGDLFVIRKKKGLFGKKTSFKKKHFGE